MDAEAMGAQTMEADSNRWRHPWTMRALLLDCNPAAASSGQAIAMPPHRRDELPMIH
jgi:hypothetical protein